MDADNGVSEVISINEICRLCANQNDRLIGIYSEDGVNNELATKMNMYLPIKVNESDDLPLQCCWQCASTVLAWHELVITSLEADRRLKNYQLGTEKQIDTTAESNFDAVILESNDTVIFDNEGQIASEDDFCTQYPTKNEEGPIAQEKRSDSPQQDPDSSKESCTLCQANFSNAYMLEKHLSSFHDGTIIKTRRKKSDILSSFFCHICNKCYTRKHDMHKHILLKHPAEKNNIRTSVKVKNATILNKCKQDNIYKCDFCEAKFKRSQLLLSHRRIHTQEKPYICHICGKQFTVLAGAQRHIKQVHNKFKEIRCEYCSAYFDSNHKKNEHMNVHTHNKPYLCDICGKCFGQRATLFAHKIYHSNNYQYECRWCEKKIKRKSELKLHELKHTEEKRFSCFICKKSFSVYTNLKKHASIHVKRTCEECGICFDNKKLLKLHKETHVSTIKQFK